MPNSKNEANSDAVAFISSAYTSLIAVPKLPVPNEVFPVRFDQFLIDCQRAPGRKSTTWANLYESMHIFLIRSI